MNKKIILFGGLGLIILVIGLIPLYKNFKGKQLCLDLKNDQWNGEKANRLEEFTGIVGSKNYDYCAERGVTEMTDEPYPF